MAKRKRKVKVPGFQYKDEPTPGSGINFLDEFKQAKRKHKRATAKMLLDCDKEIASWPLPEGWRKIPGPPPITEIRDQRHYALSVSLEDDGPILLFVPDRKKEDHYHIVLNDEQAYTLYRWLQQHFEWQRFFAPLTQRSNP